MALFLERNRILLPDNKQCNKLKINYFIALSVLFSQFVIGQFAKNWHGKIIADSPDLEGIYVLNLKSKVATTTSKGGYFEISGTIGDSIALSGFQLKPLKIALAQQNFSKELFFVKMESIVTFLEEVKINQYQNINALSLGILQKPAKEYTPAERRLYTATSGGGIDGLLNLLSGRTKMLKRDIEVEKKEMALEKIELLFDEKYFTQTLKIPVDKIKAFEYYCVEDYKFNAALKSKNKTMAKFLLIDLARNYLLIQNK